MISKSSIEYQNGLNFLIELSVKSQYEFLKLYQVTKKVPTPRTLELLRFYA
jgi:hypothetical protein